MSWWIVLIPAVSGVVLCAWRGLPRAFAAAAACASALAALIGLAAGWAGGAGWPWPLELSLGGAGAGGWIDLRGWQPRAGLLLDPLSLVTAALAGVAFAACALEGARWRVAPAALARGVGLQACVVAAALAGDLLITLSAAAAAAACAAWQHEAPRARSVLGLGLGLVGVAWLADPGGTGFAALARGDASPWGVALVLAALVALRQSHGEPAGDPVRAGVVQGMHDAAAALVLTLVLARLAPVWVASSTLRAGLAYAGVACAALAAARSLRAATPPRAAAHAADAALALVVVAATCEPLAGLRLGWAAALGLPALQLGLAGLAQGRPQGARRWAGLGALLAAGLLVGLPPWSAHQAWSLALTAALATDPLRVAAAVAAWAAAAAAIGQLGAWAWTRPSPRATRVDPPWATLALAALATAPAGLWAAAPAPADLAARLLGDPTASAAPPTSTLGAGLALLGFALGLGLAAAVRLRRPTWAGASWSGRAIARASDALAGWAHRADAWTTARTRRLGLAAQRLWERPDPLPTETTPPALGDAYRDAGLTALLALVALGLAVWLG